MDIKKYQILSTSLKECLILNYSTTRAYYDVAVAIADIPIDFTDFIRPINLPMQPIDDENAFQV